MIEGNRQNQPHYVITLSHILGLKLALFNSRKNREREEKFNILVSMWSYLIISGKSVSNGFRLGGEAGVRLHT
jgi:hypothetical protein